MKKKICQNERKSDRDPLIGFLSEALIKMGTGAFLNNDHCAIISISSSETILTKTHACVWLLNDEKNSYVRLARENLEDNSLINSIIWMTESSFVDVINDDAS